MSDQVLGYLKLSNANGTIHKTITHIEENIHPGFTKVEVMNQPASFWVIYKDTDYSYNTTNGIGVKVDDKHDMGVDIRSAQGFNNTNPSIVIFQDFNMSGFGVQYYNTSQLSADTFPPGTWKGVSSFYVVGGTWQFYNAQGDQIGKEKYTQGFDQLIVNDGINDKS